jgi:replicative DNA helicase
MDRIRTIEEDFLSILINDPDKRLEILTTDIDVSYFDNLFNQKLFAAISNLSKAGKPINLVTLDNLINHDNDDHIFTQLNLISDNYLSSDPASYYLKILKENSGNRKFYKILKKHMEPYQEDVTGKICVEGVDLNKQCSDLTKDLIDMSMLKPNKQQTMKEVLMESLEDLDKEGDNDNCSRTFIQDIDNFTMTIPRGSLVVIAGPKSIGKSTYAQNIVRKMCMNGKRCLIFSGEMSKKQYVNRFLSSMSDVTTGQMRLRCLLPREKQAIYSAAEIMDKWPIEIDASGRFTLDKMYNSLKILEAKGELPEAVFLDHFQITVEPDSRSENEELNKISVGCKKMALDFNLVFYGLSQLTKLGELPGVMPIMDHVRGSGMLTANADIVMMLRRGDYQKMGNSDNEIEVHFVKHRDGPIGKVKLYYNYKYNFIDDLAV